MSSNYPMDYFPPKGAKYTWQPRSLNHSPVTCSVKCLTWPQGLVLSCDREANGYRGYLDFISISGGPRLLKNTRLYKTALGACRAIERMGDALLEKDNKPWMKEALQDKWRPPASRCVYRDT